MKLVPVVLWGLAVFASEASSPIETSRIHPGQFVSPTKAVRIFVKASFPSMISPYLIES